MQLSLTKAEIETVLRKFEGLVYEKSIPSISAALISKMCDKQASTDTTSVDLLATTMIIATKMESLSGYVTMDNKAVELVPDLPVDGEDFVGYPTSKNFPLASAMHNLAQRLLEK